MYRNAFDVVVQVDQNYPTLIHDDPGRFVDQVAHRLNSLDGELRWGRKRKNDGSLNLDALTYLNVKDDFTKKTIVDIIIAKGTQNARPAWQEFLGDNVGNGTWAPPQSSDLDVEQVHIVEGHPISQDLPNPEHQATIDDLIQVINNNNTQILAAIKQINDTLISMRQGAEKSIPPLIQEILKRGL